MEAGPCPLPDFSRLVSETLFLSSLSQSLRRPWVSPVSAREEGILNRLISLLGSRGTGASDAGVGAKGVWD